MRLFMNGLPNSSDVNKGDWGNNSLIEPDLVFPEDFFKETQTSILDVPEAKLLYAVILDALETLVRYLGVIRDSNSMPMEAWRSRKIINECLRWFYSDSRNWITSYRNICDVLDINEKNLREKIAKMAGLSRARIEDLSKEIQYIGMNRPVASLKRTYKKKKKGESITPT